MTLNIEGQLLTYDEFLTKFRLPITPKEHAVVSDAVPKTVLQLPRGSVTEVSLIDPGSSGIFLGEMDITKSKCLNKNIRNLILTVTVPCARFFWTSLYREINWKKIWLTGDKFCLNNNV